MRVRLSMVLLLILATISTTSGHPLSFKSYSLPAPQQKELTPEEEEEARDVARRFSESWQAKHDFGQIIDELFVKDFRESLWQVPHSELPWMLLDKNLVVDASPKEMQRYYIAAMNFYGLFFGLQEVAERLREESENKDSEVSVTDILSPEVVSVLLENQTFVRLAEIAKGTRSDEPTEEDITRQSAESADSAQAARATAEDNAYDSAEQDEIGIIKKIPQLNAASATLEKANELMRKRLVERLAKLSSKKHADAEKDTAAESKESMRNLLLDGLGEEAYGYPKDTPVVHLDVASFCLYLTKIDGRFRILVAAIYID